MWDGSKLIYLIGCALLTSDGRVYHYDLESEKLQPISLPQKAVAVFCGQNYIGVVLSSGMQQLHIRKFSIICVRSPLIDFR